MVTQCIQTKKLKKERETSFHSYNTRKLPSPKIHKAHRKELKAGKYMK